MTITNFAFESAYAFNRVSLPVRKLRTRVEAFI